MNKNPALARRVFIGVPCYDSAPARTLEDFMRFAYHLGRRMPAYDFFLGIIPKYEQFRARNTIVSGAISLGCDYLLMLDDDMVIDYLGTVKPTAQLDFLRKMIGHMEADKQLGVCGALYYQRGGSYHPVAMMQRGGNKFWMTEEQIERKLQPVHVAGGGCLLIRMELFDKIPSPWFEPEQQTEGLNRGTDVQLCEKAQEAGYAVAVDTSIELGHVQVERIVIHSGNRLEKMRESARFRSDANDEWDASGMITLFSIDAEEYTGKTRLELEAMADDYNAGMNVILPYLLESRMEEWYATRGVDHLARQYYYHRQPGYGSAPFLHSVKDMLGSESRYGLDFGCGAAPLGFELLMKGHSLDFVDIEGSESYAFVKWRAEKHSLESSCGWALKGPYDFVLMLDVIEHLSDWQEKLFDVITRVKQGGMLITNYFANKDHENPEHINMDHAGVRSMLVVEGFTPGNAYYWRKDSARALDRSAA